MEHANSQRGGGKTMEKCTSTIPAQPAIDLGDDTLVITLEEVVSPTEKTPPRAVADAIQMREIYRQFIADALASLRQHMKALSDEYESAPEAVPVFARVDGSAPNGWDSQAEPASSEDPRLRRFVRSATSQVH
jgi:hypothetical protein